MVSLIEDRQMGVQQRWDGSSGTYLCHEVTSDVVSGSVITSQPISVTQLLLVFTERMKLYVGQTDCYPPLIRVTVYDPT
jgi:hypothetical protein